MDLVAFLAFAPFVFALLLAAFLVVRLTDFLEAFFLALYASFLGPFFMDAVLLLTIVTEVYPFSSFLTHFFMKAEVSNTLGPFA